MQIFSFAHEIKPKIVVFMLLSANNFAATEEPIATTPASLPENGAKTVNPIMAIVLVCLLSAFFMLCVVSTYFRHYTERQLRLATSTTHGSEPGSMRSAVHGLDPAVIATFPSFLYSSVKGIKIGETVLECVVCLNEFQDHETLRLLPTCSHVFHRYCIDTWLASHVTCPVCRADLVLRPNGPRPLGYPTEPLDFPGDLERDSGSTEFLLPIEFKQILTPSTRMSRSHSTGHLVLVQPVENIERYTLRLPNEALGLYTNLVTTSPPTGPYTVFSKESSEKMTFRSVSVGSTRPLDYARYDQFKYERACAESSRGGSSSSYVATGGNALNQTSNSQRFFRSVRSPFNPFLPASSTNLDV